MLSTGGTGMAGLAYMPQEVGSYPERKLSLECGIKQVSQGQEERREPGVQSRVRHLKCMPLGMSIIFLGMLCLVPLVPFTLSPMFPQGLIGISRKIH